MFQILDPLRIASENWFPLAQPAVYHDSYSDLNYHVSVTLIDKHVHP